MTMTAIYYVARRFYIKPDDITGPSRLRHISKARAVVVHLMRYKHNMSYPHIAKFINRSDHTSPLWLIKNIPSIIKHSPVIEQMIMDYMEGPRLPPPTEKFKPFEEDPWQPDKIIGGDSAKLKFRVQWAEYKSGVL